MRVRRLTFFEFIMRSLWRGRRNSWRAFTAYRDRSLRELLQHARERVPFQTPRLAGVDLDRIRLEAIPPTDKTAMMAAFDDTIADGAVTLDDVQRTEVESSSRELPVVKGKYLAIKTSGSSGKPSWLVCEMRDWGILRGATFARMAGDWLTFRKLAGMIFRPMRMATLAAEHIHSMTWQACRSAELSVGPLARIRFFSVIDSTERVLAGLNAFRPDYLHSYPTAMESLARYRLEGGRFEFEPQLISVGSEALTEIARDAIRRAFPASRLVDHYGTSECLPLATGCRHGRKHLNIDYALLEAMDRHGRPAPAGDLSDHVLITNLVNRAQPIIRYRIDDAVRLIPEPCRCGSVLPTIEIESRKGSVIYLRNERGDWQTLSPPIVVDMMLHTTGVAQYQLVHVRQNELVLRYRAERGCDSAAAAESIRLAFDRTLERLYCRRTVLLCIEPVEQLRRTEGGEKLLQVVSHVASPAAENRRVA